MALLCYEPAVSWDGETCGIAVSAFTQALFLRLSLAGELLTGPVQLPGLPSGDDAGRTAAFKVLWTGQAYAVFGLWLEREFPAQDLTAGAFYTHLFYWLVDKQGKILAQAALRTLAPTSYPSGEGAEKNYFDVVWTGQSFWVAYYGESQSGPPLSVYYRLFDLTRDSLFGKSPGAEKDNLGRIDRCQSSRLRGTHAHSGFVGADPDRINPRASS
jgi:hypothetical protein